MSCLDSVREPSLPYPQVYIYLYWYCRYWYPQVYNLPVLVLQVLVSTGIYLPVLILQVSDEIFNMLSTNDLLLSVFVFLPTYS